MTSPVIKVPEDVYREARQIQMKLKNSGINISLWACVAEVKRRRDGGRSKTIIDPFNNLRL